MYYTLVVADPCGDQAYDEETLEDTCDALTVSRLILNTSSQTKWIKKLGSKLSLLWISNPISIAFGCISRYCSDVKHVVLVEVNCLSEREKTPPGFWSCIGASLVTLQIEFIENCAEEVRGIMTYCRNLKELVIIGHVSITQRTSF